MRGAAKFGFTSLDEYLSSQDEEARKRLSLICEIIREAAPQAEDRIRGFYPASMTVFDKFHDELKGFKQARVARRREAFREGR